MARPTRDTEQITFRIERKYLDEADALTGPMSQPGDPKQRTDVFRVAIALGLAALREKYAPPKKK